MVVGNGMIAKAFSIYADDDHVVIFASGVANSRTTDAREFDREQCLLRTTLERNSHRLFVYISTCSVEDKDEANSPYVVHKMNMESMVSSSTGSYLLLRLPQVVGKSTNPHTLVNYLYDRIIRGERVFVWQNAVRYLIDIEDVVRITEYLIGQTAFRNVAVNIVSRPYTIASIVSSLEKVTGKTAICESDPRGTRYRIDDTLCSRIANELNISFDESYLDAVLTKYYSKSA